MCRERYIWRRRREAPHDRNAVYSLRVAIVNSLQIGLIAIGAVVVALLFLWHWWQSRRGDRPAKVARPAPQEIARPSTPSPAPTPVPARMPVAEPTYERVEPTLDVRAAGVWEPSVSDRKPEEITYGEIQPAHLAHDTFKEIVVAEPSSRSPPAPITVMRRPPESLATCGRSAAMAASTASGVWA